MDRAAGPALPIAVELVGGHRQPVVLTQRRTRVVLPEQSLASQDGQYVVDEGLQSGGQRRGHDVEPVRGPTLEPGDDRVDDLIRCTDESEVTASAAQSRQDLAHGEVFARLWAPSSLGRANTKSGNGLSSSKADESVSRTLASCHSPYSGTRSSSSC